MPSYPEENPLLILPSSFGSLYVGETFRALLSLHSEVDEMTSYNHKINRGASPVQLSTGGDSSAHQGAGKDSAGKDRSVNGGDLENNNIPEGPPYVAATLMVTLTTPEQKQPIVLVSSSSPDSTAHLEPGGNKQFTVDFETTEVGVHTISATVTYTPVQPLYSEEQESLPPSSPVADSTDNKALNSVFSSKDSKKEPVSFVSVGQQGSYTKNYRFSTETGFNVGTKMTAITHDTCVVQARIENVTDTTACIETADFLAPVGWISKSLARTGVIGGSKVGRILFEGEDENGNGEGDNDVNEIQELDEYGLADAPSDLYLTDISTPSLMPKEAWQFAYLVEHDPDFYPSTAGSPATGSSTPSDLTTAGSTAEQTQRQQPPKISPPPSVNQQSRQSVGTGKFSFSWRREPLGEKGWFMTGHLKRTNSLEYW